MITVSFPGGEYFDQERNEFITIKPKTVTMEHSLLSISKWESKWHKPFFGDNIAKYAKTEQEILDYFRCMCITPGVTSEEFASLPFEEGRRIREYMNDTMTATWFNERGMRRAPSRKIITNEVIYSQMAEFGIPFECEKWHINRLMVLIRVCSQRNVQPEKMKKNDIAKQYAALNAARSKKTSGVR